MKGKAKCKALKEIRRQIAEQNDIPYAVSQCTYQGDCKGTCPKCEAELKYLERELAIRQGLGKAVAVAGISVGLCTPLTACSPVDSVKNFIENIGHEELAGDIAAPEVDYKGELTMEEDLGTEPTESLDDDADDDDYKIDEEYFLAGDIAPVE